jgi:probable HAF family extracellular repeat protein
MGLGDLPGGVASSLAFGVSGDGSVVVGSSDSGDPSNEAFVWTQATGMVGLGGRGEASAVSGDGRVVVGVDHDSGAFRWTIEDGSTFIADVPSHAHDVSADGSVIVGQAPLPTGLAEAFVWSESSGVMRLGDLGGDPEISSSARGVSNDGTIVVGIAASTEGQQSFRWTAAEGMVGIGSLSPIPDAFGFLSGAFDVSGDGETIVGSSTSTSVSTPGAGEAFIWTQASGMRGLGDLPGGDFHSQALGASFDGSVVVGIGAAAGSNQAFIWDEAHGMRDLATVLSTVYGLDLGGWTLWAAEAISDDGRTIVGVGRNPAGQGEAWLAVLPEPSVWTFALLGLAALAWRHRHSAAPRRLPR